MLLRGLNQCPDALGWILGYGNVPNHIAHVFTAGIPSHVRPSSRRPADFLPVRQDVNLLGQMNRSTGPRRVSISSSLR